MSQHYEVKGVINKRAGVVGTIKVGNELRELRFLNRDLFPKEGTKGILYIDVDSNNIYYWDDSYILLTHSLVKIIDDLVTSSETTWSSDKINETFVRNVDLEDLTKQVYSGTTSYWEKEGKTISRKDVVYIYTDRRIENEVPIPGIKIGDGLSYIVDLPFSESSNVTQEEKNYWNNKVSAKMSETIDENLIFYV